MTWVWKRDRCRLEPTLADSTQTGKKKRGTEWKTKLVLPEETHSGSIDEKKTVSETNWEAVQAKFKLKTGSNNVKMFKYGLTFSGSLSRKTFIVLHSVDCMKSDRNSCVKKASVFQKQTTNSYYSEATLQLHFLLPDSFTSASLRTCKPWGTWVLMHLFSKASL